MTDIMKLSPITEKRLHNEMKDLNKNKMEFIQGIQDENNKLIFYFLLKGDKDSSYKDGYYIGKILLPQDYPAKPGDFIMLTPNGRFEIDKKICLSNTGYHLESSSPIWSIRNVLIGIYSIWMDDKENGISHIKQTPTQRKEHAKKSVEFNNEKYRDIFLRFNQFVNENGEILSEEEQKIALESKKKKKSKDKEEE
jgi:ubiquitin-protein ligase